MNISIQFIKDLNSTELENFYESPLGILTRTSYAFQATTINYYQAYFNYTCVDLSLIIFCDAIPAICLFIFCKDSQFSYFDMPIQIFETPDLTSFNIDACYKRLFEKINELALKKSIQYMYVIENEYLRGYFWGQIEKTDFKYDVVIDLQLPNSTIKANVRNRYKQLINWGQKNLEIIKVDKDSEISKKLFYGFKAFHFQVAGRQTRSDHSWDIQYEAICEGTAYLTLASFQEHVVSGIYVTHGSKSAYYGVGVNNRELMVQNIPISHFTMMSAIYEAKNRGLKYFDLGELKLQSTDPKIVSISNYKKGFSNTITSKNILKIKF